MDYVIPPAPIPSVPVHGTSARFPVRRIYCVGRNYAEHAIEMGHSGREAPFFFTKPADALLVVEENETGAMRYPTRTQDLHHELELVVALREGGRDIAAAAAAKLIYGYAVGLDMTRRDLQGEAKKLGRPWSTGKEFDHAAPIGALRRAEECTIDATTPIALEVNGQTRQSSVVGKMIWNIAEMIEHLSTYWTLQPGDLIYTGTPEGVAATVVGDTLVARIAGLPELRVEVVGG